MYQVNQRCRFLSWTGTMNRCYWCILGLHAHAIYSDVISLCTERVLFGNTVDHFRRSWIYYSFSTVSLQPHLLLKEMSSRSLCSGHAFLLFISFYTYNTEHLRLSCTFVVDTLLNFPTLFNKILTYTNISCLNAFKRLLVSGQDWAHKSVIFRLVLAISRTETGITASYLEITSSSFVNAVIILAWPK